MSFIRLMPYSIKVKERYSRQFIKLFREGRFTASGATYNNDFFHITSSVFKSTAGRSRSLDHTVSAGIFINVVNDYENVILAYYSDRLNKVNGIASWEHYEYHIHLML